MCRRAVFDDDGVVLDADSATSDAESDDSQSTVSAHELSPDALWQVHGAYYNLEEFAKQHPGGVEQIIAQKGKDCSTLFETAHLFDEQPRKVLRKYYVRDVPGYEATLLWSGDGFYPTLKRRVSPVWRKVVGPGLHPSPPRGKLPAEVNLRFFLRSEHELLEAYQAQMLHGGSADQERIPAAKNVAWP